MDDERRLTVAVTGPTGEIGRAFLSALDRSPQVERIVGMARRPFEPERWGLRKVEYLQGDVLDRDAVKKLVDGADVVVHLAFLIFGNTEESRRINVEGSTNLFSEAVDAGAERLIYTSSVAAYGFHADHPSPITEDVEPRGSDEHPYSREKAEVEQALGSITGGREIDVYVFRPCIVAGPSALMLIRKIPFVRLGERLPRSVRKVMDRLPALRPVVPDPGQPFQLVHEDDVASALVAATGGKGAPGAYNLAGPGEVTLSDLAGALGWYSIPLPEIALDATAGVVSRIPLLPVEARWVNAIRVPMIVSSERAESELGWAPRYDALETLSQTVTSARAQGLPLWPQRG